VVPIKCPSANQQTSHPVVIPHPLTANCPYARQPSNPHLTSHNRVRKLREDHYRMSSPSPAYTPYQPHRNSQSFDPNTPPAPPPKPNSQEVSRRSTPAGAQPLPPPPPSEAAGSYGAKSEDPPSQQARMSHAQHIEDPGEQWLPKILEDKPYATLRALLEYELNLLQKTRSRRHLSKA
jgi:hypothetical protein